MNTWNTLCLYKSSQPYTIIYAIAAWYYNIISVLFARAISQGRKSNNLRPLPDACIYNYHVKRIGTSMIYGYNIVWGVCVGVRGWVCEWCVWDSAIGRVRSSFVEPHSRVWSPIAKWWNEFHLHEKSINGSSERA